MCNLSKGVREEGILQGIQQGRKYTLNRVDCESYTKYETDV